MRVHVLGIGPIGSLLAFHLRRSLPVTVPISLVVKTKARARDLRVNGGIAIETGGTAITQKGFDIEIFEPLEEVVYDMVYNKGGEMRLPSTNPYIPKRSGELDGTTMNMEEINRPIESLIICAKAQHTLGIFKHMRRRLTHDSTVVLLQNGMGVYEQIVHNFYRNPLERPHFVIATTSHAARAKTQGSMFHTIHVGQGDLAFGIIPDPRNQRNFETSRYDTKPLSDRALSLDDICLKGRPDRYSSLRSTIAILSSVKPLKPIWEPIADLQIRVKRKLVVNSVINPLTALLSTSNGMLFGHESARYIMASVCDEAANVFAKEYSSATHPANLMADTVTATITDMGGNEPFSAAQYQLPWGANTSESQKTAAPEQNDLQSPPEPPKGLRSWELQSEIMRVASKTALNYSSMLVDTWKGRETEIEFLNGYLRRLGRFYDVPMPYNNSLYNMMRLREAIVPTVRL